VIRRILREPLLHFLLIDIARPLSKPTIGKLIAVA